MTQTATTPPTLSGATATTHLVSGVAASVPPGKGADRRLFGFAAGVWAASLAGLWLSPDRAWTAALAIATLVLAIVAWPPALVTLWHRRSAPHSYQPRHLRRGA